MCTRRYSGKVDDRGALLDFFGPYFDAMRPLTQLSDRFCEAKEAKSIGMFFSDFIVLDTDHKMYISMQEWLSYDQTLDLESKLKDDVNAGLHMCRIFPQGMSMQPGLNLFSAQAPALQITVHNAIVTHDVDLPNQYDAVLFSSKRRRLYKLHQRLTVCMCYADTWLMLHTLLRSSILLDKYNDADRGILIDSVFLTMLDLISNTRII